ncbi:MAG: virulence protein, partial [Schwartzia sp.]|nr:virulence protein [Schwartzia sp. (in: firmicutes)]
SKEGLIKKALGIDALPIMFKHEKISFPWFETQPDADVAKAAMEFIAALCRTAKTITRVTAKEHSVPNEKYAFRCFLLRLGFIGKEHKETRKVLLRNLSGNGSFRDGKKKEATEDAVSE